MPRSVNVIYYTHSKETCLHMYIYIYINIYELVSAFCVGNAVISPSSQLSQLTKKQYQLRIYIPSMYWGFSLKHANFFKFIITSKNDIENAECVPCVQKLEAFLDY